MRRARVAVAWTYCALVAGCAGPALYVWVDDLPDQAFAVDPYRIHPGDVMAILVWNQPNLSGELRVRPDGMVSVPLVGDVAVEGLTPTACAAQIMSRLAGLVLEPKVTVNLRETRPPSVSVIGQVVDAGDYPLREGDTVLQVLARASGLTEFADPERIFVVRRRPELLRVRFAYSTLVAGEGRALSFKLRDGDIVVVE
jgi:polysaccharide export outer membrane protein